MRERIFFLTNHHKKKIKAKSPPAKCKQQFSLIHRVTTNCSQLFYIEGKFIPTLSYSKTKKKMVKFYYTQKCYHSLELIAFFLFQVLVALCRTSPFLDAQQSFSLSNLQHNNNSKTGKLKVNQHLRATQ